MVEVEGSTLVKSPPFYYFEATYTTVGAEAVVLWLRLPEFLVPSVYEVSTIVVYHTSGANKTVTVGFAPGSKSPVTNIYSASVATATATLPTWSGNLRFPPTWWIRMTVTPGAAAKLALLGVLVEAKK